MTLHDIRHALQQAKDLGSIEWIYFEGGEPFLYHAILLKGVQEASAEGFRVGIVSNAYWATGVEDALEWLRPFAGLVEDLSVSSDLFHYAESLSQQAKNACQAAESLGIPIGTISIAQPEATEASRVTGKLPSDESGVMYRGRAAEKLAVRTTWQPWTTFTECPFDDLRNREDAPGLRGAAYLPGTPLGICSNPIVEICCVQPRHASHHRASVGGRL
jgi:hypothetical protein